VIDVRVEHDGLHVEIDRVEEAPHELEAAFVRVERRERRLRVLGDVLRIAGAHALPCAERRAETFERADEDGATRHHDARHRRRNLVGLAMVTHVLDRQAARVELIGLRMIDVARDGHCAVIVHDVREHVATRTTAQRQPLREAQVRIRVQPEVAEL
jgi:hypothetical protein